MHCILQHKVRPDHHTKKALLLQLASRAGERQFLKMVMQIDLAPTQHASQSRIESVGWRTTRDSCIL